MSIQHQNSFRLRLTALLGLLLIVPAALAAQSATIPPLSGAHATAAYRAPTDDERMDWFVDSTVGARSLATGVVSAGWGTWLDNPEEYSTHWGGFAKRYGMRLSGVATGNAIEAGLGKALDEDPRYVPSGRIRPWERVRYAAKMTVMAYHGDGSIKPAYARYTAIAGNNFLSNAWRAPSESSVSSALTRIALGFTGRFIGNTFQEFWSDLKSKVSGHK